MIVLAAAPRSQVSYWRTAFRSSISGPSYEAHPVLEVTLPDGTTWRAATGEVPSTSRGAFEGRVQAWGSFTRAVSLRDGHLMSVELSLRLDDADRSFSRIVNRFQGRLRGAAATVRWLAPGLPIEDCPVEYTGVVHNFPQTSEFVYTLDLRPPDNTLRNGKIPQQLISVADYPRAKADVIGKPFPLAYGRFDSTGFEAKGLVPAYRVDGTSFVYLVCLGRVPVRAVFKAGVVAPTSDYTVAYKRGGKTVTEITFTADPGESTAITVDTDGYDDRGDGTGVAIANPVRQMQHLLENFIYGNWTSGSWLTGQAPLDPRAWDVAARKLDRRGYQGAHWRGGDRAQPLAVFNAFCEAVGLVSWWTAAGTIAVALLDPLEEDVYQDDPWLLGSSRDDGRYSRPLSVDQITRRLTGQYASNPGGSGYLQSLAVMDHTLTERSELERQNPWAAVQV